MVGITDGQHNPGIQWQTEFDSEKFPRTGLVTRATMPAAGEQSLWDDMRQRVECGNPIRRQELVQARADHLGGNDDAIGILRNVL